MLNVARLNRILHFMGIDTPKKISDSLTTGMETYHHVRMPSFRI